MAIPTTDTQPSLLSAATAPNPGRTSTIVGVAKSGGTPLGAGATATTRAKDSDRQETCTLLDNALKQTRKRFGNTTGFRLVLYPTYAVLDRADPSDDRRMLAYDYRGGWGDMRQSDVKTTYPVIEPASDPTTPGALSLSVYVSSDYGGGFIVFAGDGTTKRINLPS